LIILTFPENSFENNFHKKKKYNKPIFKMDLKLFCKKKFTFFFKKSFFFKSKKQLFLSISGKTEFGIFQIKKLSE